MGIFRQKAPVIQALESPEEIDTTEELKKRKRKREGSFVRSLSRQSKLGIQQLKSGGTGVKL